MTKKIEITNVQVSGGYATSAQRGYCLLCENEGARFHIWIGEDRKPESAIYKNPPLEIKFHDAGYFKTRTLSAYTAFGQSLLAAMLAQAEREDLFAKHRASVNDENARLKAIADAANRDALVREAAPDLLDALKSLLSDVESHHADFNAHGMAIESEDHPWHITVFAARASIAKAEAA